MSVNLDIIIPVYNEGDNIIQALNLIREKVLGSYRVLIVFDFDEDSTILPAKRYIHENKLEETIVLHKNTIGRGALNAIKSGFQASNAEFVIVTMADLSDPPEVINDMVSKAVKENADIVCASRYMKDGKQIGGPLFKKTLSRIAGVSLHYLSSLPTKDVTNSFKLYRKKVLESITIESSGGFELGMEIVIKAWKSGFKIIETPTTWRDRSGGESNFKLFEWLPCYLKWYFFAFKGNSPYLKKTTEISQKTTYLVLGLIFLIGILLRVGYMNYQVGNINEPDFGGDPCHHYSIAKNIANGIGPQTDFIFSYWFRHKEIPAVTDIYPPGVHYVVAGFMKALSVDYLSARIASLVLGSLSILLIFVLSRTLIGNLGGLISAGFLAFNATHIEHSTVLMTPVIATFFVLLAFQVMLFNLKERASVWWALVFGVLVGVAHLMQNSAPVFVLTYLAVSYFLSDNKIVLYKRWPLFLIGLFISLIPWGIYTSEYFGKSFYSNLNFYPIVSGWRQMNYQLGFPPLDLSEGVFKIGVKFVFGFFQKVFTLHQYLLVVGGKLFFTLLIFPIIVSGIFININNKKIWSVFLFIILSLCALTIGSRALNWQLWPRHFISVIPFVAIIAASGVVWLLGKINFPKEIEKATCLSTLALTIVYLLLAGRNVVRHSSSFWSIDSTSYKSAALWIKNNTNKTDRIMHALVPQDLACYADRQVVIDPSEAGGPDFRYRAAEEIDYYKVKYLMLDNSGEIYNTSPIDTSRLAEYYPGVTLAEVYSDDNRKVIIYAVR